MKLHITPEDLLNLSDSQKLNLRDMWMPEVNTLVMAKICRDVINDEYDTIVFVIGEVIVDEDRGNLILRKYKLLDESFYEDNRNFFENENEPECVENEEDFEFEYAEPEQYFSKEDCLPLPGIGQLIEMLNRAKYGQDGFDIYIPPVRRMVGDKGYSVVNRNEHEFTEDELCDSLWKALIEYF